MVTLPSKILERFDNPAPDRNYEIDFETSEFTCLCPKTGQPDFAAVSITYVADKYCVELKSLKLYLWSYRNEGHFHEAVTNMIFDDLMKLLQPRELQIRLDFKVRGGIETSISCRYPER